MTSVRAALASIGLPEPVSASSLAGGCVHDVRLVELGSGDRVVCKVAAGAVGIAMLQSETRGLAAIAATRSLRTPRVHQLVCDGDGAVLVMEYLPKGTEGDWARAGRQLAQMHAAEAGPRYGSEEEVWLGGTRLRSGWDHDWCEHLAERRLRPLLRDVLDSRAIGEREAAAIDAVIAGLPARIPAAPTASLLHGDLWAGNFHIMRDGGVAVLDPAAVIGDPFLDIAMSSLFGGVPRAFFGAWRESFGDEEAEDERIAAGQMLHLLNHVRLFGAGYVPQLMGVVAALE
ncbi:MAG: fructosamine kinase family protein [Phycisphaerales bacterium]|jgi:fructosamine-3-kinase|nr:fructosamine kinase family protein [Phycisphaerales bacterium]